MKFASLGSLLSLVIFSTPVFGETLASGAIYFDSENTLQEVFRFSGEADNAALGRLIASHHVSDKLPENADIFLYLAGPNPESPAEFRFINNPTTYWTLTKFIQGIRVAPSATDVNIPVVAIPTPTPNVLPNATPTPTPLPSPTPTPKSAVASAEREEPSDSETSPPPLLRKHHARVKLKERPPSTDDDVPDSEKVWHQVNGHWKWYQKRHEVRRALAPTESFPPSPAVPVLPNVPTAAAIPTPLPNNRAAPILRSPPGNP
jgi:hypothetical protein